MRKRFGQVLRLGVSARAVAVVAVNRFRPREMAVLAEGRCADAAVDTVGAAVRTLLTETGCSGWPLDIVVADELARIWQVTPPQDSARLADLQAAAGLRFQSLYGEPPSDWRIAADYDPAASFMAAALPRQLVTLIEHAAHSQRLNIVGIAPQLVAGFNRWHKKLAPHDWYALVHEDVLTLRAGAAVRALAVPAGADSAWLGRQIAVEALRLGVERPARVMISGAVPSGWNAVDGVSVLGAPMALSPAVRLAITGALA